jgi:outer membrane lipoprotein SlyB
LAFIKQRRFLMLAAFKVGLIVAALCAAPLLAAAGRVEGAGIGAGAGAVIAGPVGAVVGGVAGYYVGGPNIISGRRYTCWRDDRGRRRCTRR